MMTGFGQFGPIEMGGMFSVVKVREGQARNDYKDPGWYRHPQGTVSYELQDTSTRQTEAPRAPATDKQIKGQPAREIEVKAVKPKGHKDH
jgi:hypothetical protein